MLLLWAAGAVLLVLLPAGSSSRFFVAVAVYCTALIFAVGSISYLLYRADGEGRIFWTLLGGGIVSGLVGYLFWTAPVGSTFISEGIALQDLAYAVSYLLLLAAMLWLVAKTTRGIAPTSVLDTLAVMLSVGLLAWYFVLGPAAVVAQAPIQLEGWREVVVYLLAPAADASLLFLALVVFSGRMRPAFAGCLVGAFAAALVAEALYAGGDPFGNYEVGRWPDLFWALGLVILGFGALRALSSGSLRGRTEVSPWRLSLFWFSPLSPAVHYGLLLAWTATHPPVPSYVLWVGVVFMVYAALRASVFTHVSRRLELEAEEAARKKEQRRISEDLHDSLKQRVHGVPLLLEACYKAREKGNYPAADGLLSRALDASREASYQVSRPISELRLACTPAAPDPPKLFGQLLGDLEKYFGITTHQNLSAPMEALSPEELAAAAYKIVNEALWNAAKHSGAGNVRLESKKVENALLIEVHDDGCGFSEEDPRLGTGIPLMRSRAEEAGGSLEVITEPGGGTTVQVRFENR